MSEILSIILIMCISIRLNMVGLSASLIGRIPHFIVKLKEGFIIPRGICVEQLSMQNDNLNVDDTIGVDDTSPGKVLGMCTLPTGACYTAPCNGRLSRSAPNLTSVPILTTMSDGARRKSRQACAIEKALMPTYA
nr:hypothetical protein [Salinivibrio costicola]